MNDNFGYTHDELTVEPKVDSALLTELYNMPFWQTKYIERVEFECLYWGLRIVGRYPQSQDPEKRDGEIERQIGLVGSEEVLKFKMFVLTEDWAWNFNGRDVFPEEIYPHTREALLEGLKQLYEQNRIGLGSARGMPSHIAILLLAVIKHAKGNKELTEQLGNFLKSGGLFSRWLKWRFGAGAKLPIKFPHDIYIEDSRQTNFKNRIQSNIMRTWESRLEGRNYEEALQGLNEIVEDIRAHFFEGKILPVNWY